MATSSSAAAWWVHRCVRSVLAILAIPWGVVISVRASPVAQMGKKSACNAGDLDLIPGSGRSLGEGNGNPLQYWCLENPMDRGPWQAIQPMGSQELDKTNDWLLPYPFKKARNLFDSRGVFSNLLLILLPKSFHNGKFSCRKCKEMHNHQKGPLMSC